MNQIHFFNLSPSTNLLFSRPISLSLTQISLRTTFLAYIKFRSFGKLPKILIFHVFMHFRPRFWGFWKFLGFLRFLWNCWVRCFCFLLYAHGLHPHCIITMFYAYLDVCDWLLLLSVVQFRLGDPHDALNFSRHLFMHFHAYVFSFLFFSLLSSCEMFSLSLSLSLV